MKQLPLLQFAGRLRLETIFLVCLVVFGVFIVFYTPPISVVDEDVHFFRSYEVSHGDFFAKQVSPPGGYGYAVPLNITQYVFNSKYHAMGHLDEFKNSYKDPYAVQKPSTQTVTSVFNGSAVYSPILYAPQATGMAAAHVLKLDIQWYLYLGRLCNFLVFAALIYLAIRIIPVGKYALFVVGLLPMTLYQAASLSADGLTIALVALLLAFIVRLLYGAKPLTKKQILCLAIIMVLTALAKPVYILLGAGALGLLRRPYVRSRRHAAALAGLGIVLPIAIALAWYASVRHINVAIVAADPQQIAPVSQLKFILLHPLKYVKIFLVTVLYKYSTAIFPGMVGRFGWSGEEVAFLPIWGTVLSYLALLTAAIAERGPGIKAPLLRGWRHTSPLVFWSAILAIVGTTTTLYLTFTPVGAPYIEGLQGRYYIPILVPLLLWGAISSKSIITSAYRHKAKILVVAVSLLNILVMICMMQRQFY